MRVEGYSAARSLIADGSCAVEKKKVMGDFEQILGSEVFEASGPLSFVGVVLGGGYDGADHFVFHFTAAAGVVGAHTVGKRTERIPSVTRWV